MKYPIEVNETRKINRITIKQSFVDLMNAFNLERGLIFTIKLLFIRPGSMVRLYLAEGRFQIVNAFRLLVLTTAVSLFMMYLTGVDEFLLGFQNEFSSDLTGTEQEDSEYIAGLMQQIYLEWYNLFLWISIPFYGFFAFLFFSRKNYNFAEHMVIQSFYICAMNVLTIIVFPLHYAIGQGPMIYLSFSLSTAYFFFFIIKVFEISSFGGVLRTILLFIVSNIIYLLVLALILATLVGNEVGSLQG
ncbi:DUF3667 domain-containing protein [Ekhidna sp. To15]|uniref:DUF3667 domain-containing protein n=1 Tax=Ekhidna sp. To15 TaxID=3395267 RepID=UPI003F51E36F